MATWKLPSGLASALPSSAPTGTIFWTEDTEEIWVGTGTGLVRFIPSTGGGGGGPPSGPAGGDLAGTYPDPTVQDDSHSHTPGTSIPSYPVVPASLPPSGPAGGDLAGTYPDPTVQDDSHSHTPGTSIPSYPVVPASLPPSGPAGGDLAGTYPDPTLAPSGVSAGTAGQVTVDLKGRVTAKTTVADLAHGGTGSDLAATGPGYLRQGVAGAPVVVTAIPVGDLTPFGPAGALHSKGAVTDPGAVSHANHPHVLRDDGTWSAVPGELLGIFRVLTDESTTSAAAVDLTSVQLVSLTLDVSTPLLIIGIAECYCATAAPIPTLYATIDGVANQIASVIPAGANFVSALIGTHGVTLAAGLHLIKLQFASAGGLVTHFRYRTLLVFRSL